MTLAWALDYQAVQHCSLVASSVILFFMLVTTVYWWLISSGQNASYVS